MHSALEAAHFPLHYSIWVGNRVWAALCAWCTGTMVSVVGGHADRATGEALGVVIRARPGRFGSLVFSPENLAHFAWRLTGRMGGAGQLGSCQGVAAPRQATAARGFIEGKVWGGSGWKLRGRDSQVSLSGSDWRRHSSFRSSLSALRDRAYLSYK